jgi:hypothetical protein
MSAPSLARRSLWPARARLHTRAEYRAIAHADLFDGLSTLAGNENLLSCTIPTAEAFQGARNLRQHEPMQRVEGETP